LGIKAAVVAFFLLKQGQFVHFLHYLNKFIALLGVRFSRFNKKDLFRIYYIYYICTIKSDKPPEAMTTTIKPNTTITAKSVCDSNCIFSVKVLDRKNDTVTLQFNNEAPFKKKVKKSYDGSEYVMALGTYSMAPMFK